MNSTQKGLAQKGMRTAVVLFGLALGACGKIPSPYQGKFVHSGTGLQMELKANEGVWSRPDGSQQVFSARAAGAKELSEGVPGIYLRSIEQEQLEVFWVRPIAETRREEFGFVSFEAEVVYSRFSSRSHSDPVRSFLVRYCDRGQVLIDTVSQTFNGGCPADSQLIELVRVNSQN